MPGEFDGIEAVEAFKELVGERVGTISLEEEDLCFVCCFYTLYALQQSADISLVGVAAFSLPFN